MSLNFRPSHFIPWWCPCTIMPGYVVPWLKPRAPCIPGALPLELGSQVVVRCPGVSHLILSPVTKFQPYRPSFHPVNVFLLPAFAVSTAFGSSSKWPLILLLLLSLNALCDDSLSFILLHVHHFLHRTHHDLDFSSIFLSHLYTYACGGPGVSGCTQAYCGACVAVRRQL